MFNFLFKKKNPLNTEAARASPTSAKIKDKPNHPTFNA